MFLVFLLTVMIIGVIGMLFEFINWLKKKKPKKYFNFFALIFLIGLSIIIVFEPKFKNYEITTRNSDVTIEYKVKKSLTEDGLVGDSLDKFRSIIKKENLNKYNQVTYTVFAKAADQKDVVAINLVFDGNKLASDLTNKQLINVAKSMISDAALTEIVEYIE